MYAARLVSSLIDSHAPMQEFFKLNIDATLFVNQERELVDYVLAHVGQYGVFPTREALFDATTVGLVKLPIPVAGQSNEVPKYYYDKATEQFLHHSIRAAALGIQDALGDSDINGALSLLTKSAVELQTTKNKDALINFSQQGYAQVLGEYKKKLTLGDSYGLSTGWPTLDEMTGGGLIGGDVMSIVGRPAMGKTYKLLYIAVHCWLQGKVPLIVSMEMKPLPIMQRLAGMMSKIPVHLIKGANLADYGLAKLKTSLAAQQAHHPFWIVDGALNSTVDDILMTTKQLRPDVLFIDGAYLLRHQNTRMGRTEKMTENAEAVKRDLAEGCNIPVIQSYQFNRDATKKKSGTPGVEHIANTDAIGQLSSLVLGIMQKESVETMRQRQIKILKGRDGQSGEFNINWLFEYPDAMNFTEVKTVGVEELQFM